MNAVNVGIPLVSSHISVATKDIILERNHMDTERNKALKKAIPT